MKLPKGKGARGIEIIVAFTDTKGELRRRWLKPDVRDRFQVDFEGALASVRVVAGVDTTLTRFGSEVLKQKTKAKLVDLGTVDLQKMLRPYQVKVVSTEKKTFRMAMWNELPPRDVSLGSKQFPEYESGKPIEWLIPGDAKSIYFLVEEPGDGQRGIQWRTGKHHLFGPFSAGQIPAELKLN